jgi:acyl carrier protein
MSTYMTEHLSSAKADLYTRLTAICRDVFSDQSIDLVRELTLTNSKARDSLRYVTLIVAIESEFNISFRTADLAKMVNIRSIVQTTEKKLGYL